MTAVHDDLLKQLIKMIALESHETKPLIHINVNLDKCWQLFEDEGDERANGDNPALLQSLGSSFRTTPRALISWD